MSAGEQRISVRRPRENRCQAMITLGESDAVENQIERAEEMLACLGLVMRCAVDGYGGGTPGKSGVLRCNAERRDSAATMKAMIGAACAI